VKTVFRRNAKTPENRKTHQARNLVKTRRNFPEVPLRTRPPGTPDHPKVHFALPSFQAHSPVKTVYAETPENRKTHTLPKRYPNFLKFPEEHDLRARTTTQKCTLPSRDFPVKTVLCRNTPSNQNDTQFPLSSLKNANTQK
jgi:hypothetical protein